MPKRASKNAERRSSFRAIKYLACDVLDVLPKLQEDRSAAFRREFLVSAKLPQRAGADIALNRDPIANHREAVSHSLGVVPDRLPSR
jgi:hypothetical protein